MKLAACFLILICIAVGAKCQPAEKAPGVPIRDLIDSLVIASRIEGQLPRATINVYLDRRIKARTLGALTTFAFDSTGIKKGRITVAFYLPGCNDSIGGCWSAVYTRDMIREAEDDLQLGIVRDFVDDWKAMAPVNLESITGQWLKDNGSTQLRKTIGMRGEKYFLVVDTPRRLMGDHELRRTGANSFIRTDDSLIQYFISAAGNLITKNYTGDGHGIQDRPLVECLK